jgi:hypothetical protein
LKTCDTTLTSLNRTLGDHVSKIRKLGDYTSVSDSVTSKVIRVGQTTELDNIGNDITARAKYALGLKQDVSNKEYKAALDRYMKKVLF